jgi:hypothetical protein
MEEDKKIVCLNCFRSTHKTADCEYVLATIISESPLKQAGFEEPVVDFVENIGPDAVNEVTKNISADELKDADLNEAYDELLTQEFNPDDEEDASDDRKSGE